jgi:hypothetical protein
MLTIFHLKLNTWHFIKAQFNFASSLIKSLLHGGSKVITSASLTCSIDFTLFFDFFKILLPDS